MKCAGAEALDLIKASETGHPPAASPYRSSISGARTESGFYMRELSLLMEEAEFVVSANLSARQRWIETSNSAC
jgi:Flp pilus assembly CpaF family ATPase